MAVFEWRKLLLARDTKQCENYTTNGHYMASVGRSSVSLGPPTRPGIHSFILSTRAINEFKLENLLYAAKLLKSHTHRRRERRK